MSVLAEERSQSIAFEIVDGVVAPVDRAIFREALRNVLDNAIKHSPVDRRFSSASPGPTRAEP